MIIFLYQSVITMLLIKKNWQQIKNELAYGKKLFTLLAVVSLRWALHPLKPDVPAKGGESLVWCLPGFLSPEFSSLPRNNLREGLSARLELCTTDTIKCCNLRWREQSLPSLSYLSDMGVVLCYFWNHISSFLKVALEQSFHHGFSPRCEPAKKLPWK